MYKIPVCNFASLQKRIDKANDRAERLGVPPMVMKVVGEITEERKNAIGCVYQQRFYNVEVEGDVPKLEGWSLIASLRPVDSNNPKSEVFVQEVPGCVCPAEYRTANVRWCDHCKRKAKRTVVYILRDELGSCAQVGKTCVGEFLGNVSPESFLKKAEHVFSVEDMCREAETKREPVESSARAPVNGPDIDEFVAVATVVVRTLGWTPKSRADDKHMPTVNIVWGLCANPDDPYWKKFVEDKELKVLPGDNEQAEKALAWARAIPKDVHDTFLYNLGVVCRLPFVEFRNAPMVACVVESYRRNMTPIEAKNPAKESKHIGAVGERLILKGLTVVTVKERNNDFGLSHLIVLQDTEGNLIEWWASAGVDVDWAPVGSTVDVRATVKRHGAYLGVLRTVVERVAKEEGKTKPPKRKRVTPIPVTDPDLDAPDGAVIEHDGAIIERVGDQWESKDDIPF